MWPRKPEEVWVLFEIFLSISRDYFMIITIRARLVTASAGSFWGCFVIFTLCRLQPSSEIINKILFSSLITHYQRNKNKPAVGNGSSALAVQHQAATLFEGIFVRGVLVPKFQFWFCHLSDVSQCTCTPLPQTSSLLHSMDLNEQLYCMFSSHFEPPVAWHFCKHGPSHWHTAKVNKVSRISLIFSDDILTEDTGPEPEQLQLGGGGGESLPLCGPVDWSQVQCQAGLCLERERAPVCGVTRGGGTCLDQSISESVTLSHQHSTRSSMMGQAPLLVMPLPHIKKELEILQCSLNSYLNTVQA